MKKIIIIKRKKKRQIRRFDSTLGYPGEGPPQSNPQEKYNIVSLNIGGAGSQITQEKYRKLITWMVEAKVDILCIQETKSLTNHRISDLISDSGFLVMEAPNTQNHTHGGVAIIYKSHVPLKFKDADNATDWWEILSEEDKPKINRDIYQTRENAQSNIKTMM